MQRRDPKASDEEEYLENLFDVLCSCLMQPFSRTAFFEAEGDTMSVADPDHEHQRRYCCVVTVLLVKQQRDADFIAQSSRPVSF